MNSVPSSGQYRWVTMIRFLSITRTTFVQAIRQPIFIVLVFLAFAVLVVSLPLSGFTVSPGGYATTDQRQLEALGLGTLLVTGFFLAAFSACSALNRDIENRTILTVISKPVARGTFLLGKFAGVALSVALGYILCAMVFLLTVRHGVVSSASTPLHWPVIVCGCAALGLALILAGLGNYFFGWSFIAASVVLMSLTLLAALVTVSFVGVNWTIVPLAKTFGPDSQFYGQLFISIYLMFLPVLLLTGISVAASTRFGQIMTLLIGGAILLVGSRHSWMVDTLAETLAAGDTSAWGVRVLSAIIPDLSIFYPLDALAQGWESPAGLVLMKTLYFACYLLGVLALGGVMFQTRPLEPQGTASTLPGAVSLLAGSGRLAAIGCLLAAAVRLTHPSFYTMRDLLITAALAAGGVGLWVLWTAFGRNARWAYLLSFALAGLLAVGGATLLALRHWTALLPAKTDMGTILAVTVLTGGLCVVLSLPKTRNHFRPTS